jgi:hypothetical protein
MPKNLLAVVIGLAAVTACVDGGPSATGRVVVGVATDASAAGTTGEGPLFADTYTDLAGNTLVIDSVAVVVRKLKLEGGPSSTCNSDEGEGEHEMENDSLNSESASVDHDDGEEECGELKLGPFLVDLPLNGGVEHQFTVTVDTGTYTEVKFQIHKPEGSADVAFLAQHPEYAGVSIRVIGNYNGTPFVYTTGVTDEQEVEFEPPLVVTEGTTNFTLLVDLSGWFRTGAGVLVDPATALGDGVNATLVHQNIIRSFHGFEDDDHDGHDDHDD